MKVAYLIWLSFIATATPSCTWTLAKRGHHHWDWQSGHHFGPPQSYKSGTMRHGLFEKPKEWLIAGDVSKGKELFAAHCASCHGEQGDGKGWATQRYDFSAADLRNLPKDSSRYLIVMQVKQGGETMPGWHDVLSPDEVAHISEYVLSTLASGAPQQTK